MGSSPTFNTRHYAAIAQMLLEAKSMSTIEDVALFFCIKFEQDNPNFNPIMFLKACGMEHMA